MNVTALKRVRRLFTNELADRRIQRHNMRQWVRSVRYLGDKWLLAQPVAACHREGEGMTTGNYTLQLADDVDDVARTYPGMAEVSAELRRQHARITELESQLAQRFDAARKQGETP